MGESTNTWNNMAPMIEGRYDHLCGLVTHPVRGFEVVAAGGRCGNACGNLYTAEIYSVNTDSWREAKGIPASYEGAAVVPYKDSFFTLGGRYYDATTDVLWYDADNDEWIEMESKMKTPRSSHVA